MDIAGDLLSPDDKDRLDEWRKEHAFSFEGFQVDPDLRTHAFRTAGEVLFLSTEFYKKCFGQPGDPA